SSWKLSIYTEKSAQNCEIVLVVYGIDGNSGPILIGRSNDEKGLFQANRIDNFMVSSNLEDSSGLPHCTSIPCT
ncbi:unnamed protein product, partial [Schistosoma curassoni]|uniref:DCAF15_WD40 domain-containing protein n=1 Tax=Schistosoma curassoni TaxID=6186 RepID=A0A183JW16_9TREM